MARLSQLDAVLFPVAEHPLFARFVDSNGEKQIPVSDKKAIVNCATQRVLGVVSREYRLVTNREALNWAYECCHAVFPETKAAEWEVSAADAPGTGGYCRIDLIHNSSTVDFEVVAAHQRPEVFGPFIRVTNSYNAVRALSFDVGFYRKICKNGLIVPETIIRFSFSHLRRSIKQTIEFEVDSDKLAKMKASFSAYFEALRACSVPRPQFTPLLCQVLRLSRPAALKPDTPEAADWEDLCSHICELGNRYVAELGETAYAVFNAITEFASHPPTNRYVRRERHSLQRLAGAWLSTFSQECRKPGFKISEYLATAKEIDAPEEVANARA